MIHTAVRALAIGAALAATAAAASATELKLAHFMSPQHPMDRHVMTPLSEAVAATTEGALTIRVFPAGELGAGPNQQYRRAVTGVADITFNLPQYTPAQFRRSVLLHVPGLFDTPQQATEAIWANIDALDEDFSEVELLAYWTNNPAILFTRDRPVRSLADMAGLKVRTPDPVTAEIIEAWGGVPVSLPATETYNAMSTGIVDAVMIDASAVGSYNLHEVSDYVTVNVPGALSTFSLIMNKNAWERLSEAERAALTAETGRGLSMKAAEAFAEAGERGLETLEAAQVETVTLDEAARAGFVEAMRAPVGAFLKAEGEKAGFDGPAFVAGFAPLN